MAHFMFKNINKLGFQPLSSLLNLVGILPTRGYREIKIKEEDNVTTIEGKMYEDDNSKFVDRDNPEDTCPIRSRGIQVTYEDVLILNQFMTNNGDVIPRSITGLCLREHLKVTKAIKMAQRANLLPGEEPRIDHLGKEIPKLNCYLTNFPIGSQTAVKRPGPVWKRRYYKVGDPVAAQDAPTISNRRIRTGH
ncbi:large ribosomal subunit protein mL66-like [Styela clava]|uniref:39S ribosomal protein S18a, mitochondrial-like n=1 Tax=Styela clava TaxID=7725 RepID=UPI00193A66EB|nr:39S ribosomal protein S18a, mitochondrial-like [Styela clava]